MQDALRLPIDTQQTTVPDAATEALPSGDSGFSSPQQQSQQQPDPQQQADPQRPQSALSRIPVDQQGQPIYEQTDPDTAWDAILEQTEGDAYMAQSVITDIISDKEAELKRAQTAKRRQGTTVADKIAAQKERKAAIDRAQSDLDHWKQIATTQQRRQEAEAARKAAEEAAARQAAEAAAAAESEAPEWHEDTPQAARARGYRRQGGHTYRRQDPVNAVQGKAVEVKFSDDVKQQAHTALIDASTLQPSHMDGHRNISFFIDEAQPKERDGQESTAAAEKIASHINPEEITSSVTAYTGAPTVNARGEVIQGNNRSAALKAMWQSHPEQAAAYKQYLIDHASDFGLDPAAIEAMEQPVLVNMADVDDARAITLGQYTASDTESGGTERIKAQATAKKMGADMKGFTARLLRSADEDETISQLIDANAVETLKWMQRQGYITPTQYRSAFDRKGNLTAEAANDLKGILYETIFQGGSTHLREMFAELPAKAQKAILATAYRDYDSPASERMLPELQRSIIAYHELSHYAPFAKAKSMQELQSAIMMWQMQYQADENTGESYLPTEKYSNFALQLAAMYKGQTQRLMQSTLSRMLDLIQGKQERDLFSDNTEDNTPRTLAQAIREVLNIEYNGKTGSNVLADDNASGAGRRRGSQTAPQRDQQGKDGNAQADNTGRTDGNSRDGGSQGNRGIREAPAARRQQTGTPQADKDRVTPIGISDFGPIYDQFKGDAEGAIRQLEKMQDGEALGALYHKGIGYIDLVWGKAGTRKSDGYGLAKLIQFHPEAVGNLQGILDSMRVVRQSENRIQLESSEYQAAVRLTWNGEKKTWLLTAFKKRETSEPTNSSTDVDSNHEGMSDDTAPRQSSDVSADKGTTFPSENQASRKENRTETAENRTETAGNRTETPSVSEQEQIAAAESRLGIEIDRQTETPAAGKPLTHTWAVSYNSGQLTREQLSRLEEKAKALGGSYDFDMDTFNMPTEAAAQLMRQAMIEEAASEQEQQAQRKAKSSQDTSSSDPLDRARSIETERKAQNKRDDLRRRSLREAPATVLSKAAQKVIAKIAAAFGCEVRYLPTDAESNGIYDPESRTIYIAQDANMALTAVFGHELTHLIRQSSPTAYARLMSIAKTILGKRFDTIADQKEQLYRTHGFNYDRAYYEEEAVCDAIGLMIDHTDMARDILSRMSHPVLTLFRDALSHVLSLFQGAKARSAARLQRDIEQAIAQAAKDTAKTDTADSAATGVRHAFIGEQGATEADRKEESSIRLQNLATAKAMLSEGKDAKAIKLATGWERGADGKWRHETPDARFKPSTKEDLMYLSTLTGRDLEDMARIINADKTQLSDWIDAKDIFQAYPQLKSIRLMLDSSMSRGTAGYYSKKGNAIVLNANEFAPDMESTITHELQHAIQNIEGFASGGSSRTAMDYLYDSKFGGLKIKKDVAYRISQEKNFGLTKQEVDSLMDNLEDDGYPEDKLQKQIDDLCAKYGITEDQLGDIDDFGAFIHEAYRRIAGEVEARNVQARRRMPEDKRRSTLASETEDVPRHDQIVTRHSLRDDEDRALRDALIDHMRSFGMDVITDEKEGQRVLDMANMGKTRFNAKKRRAFETASVSHNEKHQPTVVSSAHGANVLKDIDKTIEKYENRANRPKTFLGDVAKSLRANRRGSASEYATFETKNGRIVTIRLANHNATVSNFDHNGESEGISIVVSPKENQGITNDGSAHVVEYYYDAIKLRRTEGKPLADILRSIKQALYSGEFKDTTGLAERQEVNAGDVARYQKVYHGSGADFDTIDHSHMGEGEGAQAYGWGTYVTEVEGIGQKYATLMDNDPSKSYIRFRHSNAVRFKKKYPSLDSFLSDKKVQERLKINRITEHEAKGHYYEMLADAEPYHHLYTVEIPDDTGKDYLDWDGEITPELQARLSKMLIDNSFKKYSDTTYGLDGEPVNLFTRADSVLQTLGNFYKQLSEALGSPEKASKALSKVGFVGIKYPSDYRRGGNKEGKSNYVIFNEADAKITDHVRFFRTPEGEAYGYTIGGKIYIDPRIATSETPIHEYTHLWSTALRQQDPAAWQDIVSAMRGTSLWNEVKENYQELDTDDDIADEVLAHYSGKRGSARLKAEMRKASASTGDILAKASAVSTLQRAKQALAIFWRKVAAMLHIPTERTADAGTIADTVLSDLLRKADPTTTAKDKTLRQQFIGKKGAASTDHAEETSTRTDNLRIARKMEEDKTDAETIKLATGWERGTDGKWRYEIPDGKYFRNGNVEYEKVRANQPWCKELDLLEERIFDGEKLSAEEDNSFGELAAEERKFKAEYLAQEKPHLANWLKND